MIGCFFIVFTSIKCRGWLHHKQQWKTCLCFRRRRCWRYVATCCEKQKQVVKINVWGYLVRQPYIPHIIVIPWNFLYQNLSQSVQNVRSLNICLEMPTEKCTNIQKQDTDCVTDNCFLVERLRRQKHEALHLSAVFSTKFITIFSFYIYRLKHGNDISPQFYVHFHPNMFFTPNTLYISFCTT